MNLASRPYRSRDSRPSNRTSQSSLPTLASVSGMAGLITLATLGGCAIPPSASSIAQMNCAELETSYRKWGQYYFHGSNDETREDLRRRFLVNCSGWPTHIREYVSHNQIREGMDEQMVLWAWGPPLRIYSSNGPIASSDIWEWSAGGTTVPTASFRDGLLVWWQSP
ncbi:MAG: hypothetical protein WC718_17465 [Phycisphaerales bacterium]|jgi:hypothetical protein